MNTYFTNTNMNQRFFMITGNTTDEFCDENLRCMDVEYLVYEHLVKVGYDRIIFYNPHNMIYFFDEKSKILTRSNTTMDVVKPKKNTPKIPGQPLKTSLKSQQKQIPTNDDPQSDSLFWGALKDADAFRYIDACMRNKKIKTAIVFTNADNFINNFAQGIPGMVENALSQYCHFSMENRNVVIFLFDSSMHSIKEKFKNSTNPLWQFINTRLHEKPKQIVTIDISQLSVGEVRNAINFARIKYKLKVEFENLENMCKMLSKKMYANKNLTTENYDDSILTSCTIKDLLVKLKELADHHISLDMNTCKRLCDIGNKKTALEKLNELIGMAGIKEQINELIAVAGIEGKKGTAIEYINRMEPVSPVSGNTMNLHICLTGNPGTGKTTVAKLFGEIYYELGYLPGGHTVKVLRNDLVGEHVGETALKTARQIENAMGGILFVDEAHTLKRSENTGNDFGQEAIDTILEAMTDKNGKFAVIVAGYPKEMQTFIESNPGLTRRFAEFIRLEDYTEEELVEIFNLNMKKKFYKADEELSELIKPFFANWYRMRDKEWGNAGDVEKLIDKMYKHWSKRIDRKMDKEFKVFEIQDIPEERKIHLKPISESKKDAIIKLDELIGLSSVKDTIKKLRNKIKHRKGKNVEPGHYIFAGNPGTGKTTVARLLGDIFCDIGVLRRGHVVEVGRDDLVSNIVGDTAIRTKAKLEEALDGILFIDEAYRLYEKSKEHNYGQEAIDTIVPFMLNNSNRLCVICAGYTNEMDDFVNSNPGLKSRFKSTIVFDDYNVDELVRILYNFAKDEYILSEEFIERSRIVFDFWLHAAKKDFGNARDVKKYFEACDDELCERLEHEYSDFDIPGDIHRTLTEKDIPKIYERLFYMQ